MTKTTTWVDWPPHQPMTLMDLVAEARAVHWDFSHWCYASGHDAATQTPVSCLTACWLTPGLTRAALD